MHSAEHFQFLPKLCRFFRILPENSDAQEAQQKTWTHDN